MNLRDLCWNCNRPIWFCKLKHLSQDLGYGLLVGGTIGSVTGALLALIYNLFFSPFARWS